MIDEQFPISVANGQHGRHVAAFLSARDVGQPLPVQRSSAWTRCAEPYITDIFTIDCQICGQSDAGKLANSRKKIDSAGYAGLIATSWSNMSRPAHETKCSNATFIHAALSRAQWSRAANTSVGCVADAIILRPIVARVKHDGVVCKLHLFECIEQAAELGVEVSE